jgi:integrase
MPLKVERRKDTGTLWIVGTVKPAGQTQGVRVRRRAGSDDPALAREEAAALEAQLLRNVWHGEKAVARGFGAAALSYLKHQERSPGSKALVRRLLLHFRDTNLDKIGQEAVDKARAALLRPGASPATVRRNLIVPLRAIMIHAAKRKWCQAPSFDLPAEPKGRTTFLLPYQAEALMEAAAPHLRPLILFLLGTGCRLGEALRLQWADTDLQAARVILWEGETKSGTRRVAHLPPAVVASMAGLKREHERVFLTQKGEGYRLTQDGKGGGQTKRAWATACRKAELPGKLKERRRSDRPSRALDFEPDFSPHHLRHTWATWHYALHRDLLRLKVEGGWSSTALVERYAHIMPSGHEDAIRRVWGLWPVPASVSQAG